MDKGLLGRFGEAQAAEYLRKKRWNVLGMNYRTRFGEIDVIAERGRYLAFVEVKLRKDASHGEAREFVTERKRQRLILAAQSYLQTHPTELQPRFDVIEVYAPEGAEGKITLTHLENAFEIG